MPCPRCGKMPRIRYRMPWNWVECRKCELTSRPVGDWYEMREEDSVIEAIEDWNERVKANNFD